MSEADAIKYLLSQLQRDLNDPTIRKKLMAAFEENGPLLLGQSGGVGTPPRAAAAAEADSVADVARALARKVREGVVGAPRGALAFTGITNLALRGDAKLALRRAAQSYGVLVGARYLDLTRFEINSIVWSLAGRIWEYGPVTRILTNFVGAISRILGVTGGGVYIVAALVLIYISTKVSIILKKVILDAGVSTSQFADNLFSEDPVVRGTALTQIGNAFSMFFSGTMTYSAAFVRILGDAGSSVMRSTKPYRNAVGSTLQRGFNALETGSYLPPPRAANPFALRRENLPPNTGVGRALQSRGRASTPAFGRAPSPAAKGWTFSPGTPASVAAPAAPAAMPLAALSSPVAASRRAASPAYGFSRREYVRGVPSLRGRASSRGRAPSRGSAAARAALAQGTRAAHIIPYDPQDANTEPESGGARRRRTRRRR